MYLLFANLLLVHTQGGEQSEVLQAKNFFFISESILKIIFLFNPASIPIPIHCETGCHDICFCFNNLIVNHLNIVFKCSEVRFAIFLYCSCKQLRIYLRNSFLRISCFVILWNVEEPFLKKYSKNLVYL